MSLQGLWPFPMAPIKTGTGNQDVRSKRTPTISVLMGKDEEYLTPCHCGSNKTLIYFLQHLYGRIGNGDLSLLWESACL